MFQKLKIAKTDEGQQNGSKEGHVTDDADTWHEQCEDAVMHWVCIRCGGRSVTREESAQFRTCKTFSKNAYLLISGLLQNISREGIPYTLPTLTIY